MEERKSRQRRRKEDKLRHWRLHSCLGVLSVSLSCQFGTFLEAWNLARSQHCSRSSPLCSEGIYREPKIDTDWVKTPFWQWMHSPFFLPLFPPRLSHLHFCDWHISWAPVPGMPSWHGSGSGRVCSASWWPHFCPGQHRSPHCRRRKKKQKKSGQFLVFRAGWITLSVIAWPCDNPPWKSSVTKKTKGLFFTSPSKQRLTEIDDGWLCVSTYNLVWEAIFSRGIFRKKKNITIIFRHFGEFTYSLFAETQIKSDIKGQKL